MKDFIVIVVTSFVLAFILAFVRIRVRYLHVDLIVWKWKIVIFDMREE